jgi:sugar lactone lactonase YvrE
VTCYDADNLVRITPGGETLETLAQDAEGWPFLGPNDAVADARGGVYFSASGKWDATAPIEGKVLYLSPDGAIAAVADDIHYANGLALSPDGSTLYVSEMAAQRVLKFEVEPDGTLGRRYLPARYVTNLTFDESEDVLFVTAAIDAWTEPYPGQVYRIERR